MLVYLMHICSIATANMLPKRRGAIAPYVYTLSKELSRTNFIDILGLGKGKEETKNLRIQTFAYNRHILNILLGYAFFNAQLLKKVLNIHKVFPIDVLHIHDPYLGFMATVCKLSFRIPVVCSLHNEVKTIMPIQGCDKILVVSRYLKKFLFHKKKMDESKIRILPVAVDVKKYKPTQNKEQAKKELGLQDCKVILFVGRKCIEKGPQVLIKAIPKVIEYYPKTTFVLIGPDYYFGSFSKAYSEFLVALAMKLGVEERLVLKGFLPENALRQYYDVADVFVCPSVWQEPLGVTILEALAYEKPVVASNVGAIPEIIGNGINGLLVPPNNPKALADAIIYLFENDELANRFGKNGRKLVQQEFSFEVIGKRCLDVYREILSKN